MKSQPAQSHGILLALALLFGAALTLLPLHAAIAAPALQDEPAEGPVPLFLGEYVSVDMANGESIEYVLEVPEAASYEIGIVDEDEAIAFDLVVTDADGNELFNDIFGSINLDLEPGEVLLQFEAVDDALLEFAVLGNIGDMTTDIEAPGSLPAGGIFYSEDVSEPLYATLTVPETDYPQQVTLYFEPGEGDGFYISVEGDDIGYVDRDSADSNLLRFWTHGGEFLVSAEPDERRSQLQLIPFLDGAPVVLTLDEPVEDVIPAGETAVIYGLPLDMQYDELTIEADAGETEIDITVVDRLYEGDFVEMSFGEPSLTLPDLLPGDYYVIVESFDVLEEDLPFTLLATGSAGAPVDTITGGSTAEGLFEAGDSSITYFLDVEEPGSLVSLALSSEVTDSDFDLEAGFDPELPVWSTFSIGSDDRMAFVAPVAGQYYVRVLSNDYEGGFELAVDEIDLAPAVNLNELTWGSVGEGEENAYRLEIPEAGDLLSVALIGPAATDLDLRLAGYDGTGLTLVYESGFSTGSAEIVSAPIEEPGIYEVVVSAEFSDGGDYVLLVRLENPSQLAGQWASDATATSEYGDDGYSALQATGEPDTPVAGDFNTAWAPAEPDAGEQTLELSYVYSVVPSAVNIHESYNPGAVVAIEAYDADADEWMFMWEGEAAAAEEELRVFSPELTVPDFATNSIRLTMDTDAVEGWNEIDAVELLGRP